MKIKLFFFHFVAMVIVLDCLQVTLAINNCNLNCVFGYLSNQNNIEVCECQDKPCTEKGCRFPMKVEKEEKSCQELENCHQKYQIIENCPNIICQNKCDFNLKIGENGCPICSCNPNPCFNIHCGKGKRCIVEKENCVEEKCDFKPSCVPACDYFQCSKTCNHGYKINELFCIDCECKQNPCDGIKCPKNQICVEKTNHPYNYTCQCLDLEKCDLDCPLGYERDHNSCPLCQCVHNSCQNLKCMEGYKCDMEQMENCLFQPCPFKPTCIKN